jgi:uncharacterized protein YeaO (DUF488 family)
MIQIKRIYDEPAKEDKTRVLIDRLWPRGISKEQAALDIWLKDVAPSNELRTWFGHKPERFAEFSKKYEAELTDNPNVETLQALARNTECLTLLYGAKDTEHNQAVVLQKVLEQRLARQTKD